MTEDELTKLYARYGYVVFRRCMLYLGDPPRAQDTVRDVFVRALRATVDARGDADPRTWLCRIADQLCVEQLRRARRDSAQLQPSEGAGLISAIEAAVANDDRESLLAMRRLALGLEPDSFRLAVLHFVDELTQEELAQELGLSRRTIGKRVQQLLERARSLPQPQSAS